MGKDKSLIYMVSVIIPAYNIENYIENCLNSVSNQSYRNIECIIVNDCSTDNTQQVVSDFISKHQNEAISYTLVNHTQNCGLSASRNTGIMKSSGKYLYFLDGDDMIVSNALELLVNNIGSSQICCANHSRVYGIVNERNTPVEPLENKTFSDNEEVIKGYYRAQWPVVAWNKLILKDFIMGNNLLFCEGLIHEDELWSYQISCVAQRITTIPDMTYLYVQRSNSIVGGTAIQKRIDSWIKVIYEMTEFRNKRSLSDITSNLLIESAVSRFFCLSFAYHASIRQKYLLYRGIRNIRKPDCHLNGLTTLHKIRAMSYVLPSMLGFLLRLTYTYLTLLK